MKYLSAAENRPAWICVQVILNEDSIKPEDFDKIKNRVIKVITNEYLYVNREPKVLSGKEWRTVAIRLTMSITSPPTSSKPSYAPITRQVLPS